MTQPREDENETLHRLVKLANMVELFSRRTCTDEWSGWTVLPGTAMATDDAAAAPYSVSHAARLGLVAAVDHLEAFVGTLRADPDKRVTLHVFAQTTLLRGALENASRTVWMLAPGASLERIARVLVWLLEDAKGGVKRNEKFGVPAGHRPARLNRIPEVLLAAGVPEAGLNQVLKEQRQNQKPGSVMKAAEEVTGIPGAEALWSACSSLAHGDMSGALSLLGLEVIARREKTSMVQLTGEVDLIFMAATAAVRMTQCAFDLYRPRPPGVHAAAPIRTRPR